MYYTNTVPSPLGDIILLSDEAYLLGLWFSDQKYFGAQYNLDAARQQNCHPLTLAKNWLTDYFDGKNPCVDDVPLNPEVTPFRKQVLTVLQTINYGDTVTYKDLSDLIQPNTIHKVNKSRAIGNAVGHNPIALLIPCHRVVGSDGALTGYAGGLARKKKLLALEQHN